MTTIAYRQGIMACDSCWSHNKLQTTSMTKMHRLSSGAIVGFAGDGDNRALIALLDRVKAPDTIPPRQALCELKTECEAILVFPNEEVWMITINPGGEGEDNYDHYDAQIWPANRGIAAAGSGSDLAIGAMSMGATPAEAVSKACQWDINSRAPVHVMTLNPAKKFKKPAPGVNDEAPRTQSRSSKKPKSR